MLIVLDAYNDHQMMEIDDSNDTSGIVKTEQNIMMMCIVVDIRNAMITIVMMVRMMDSMLSIVCNKVCCSDEKKV